MMRRVRVGFLYVTLKRCCFFQICSFFVFSRSILCLNLSLFATLILSSEDVSCRCARARKHLQSSFLCIICSWTTPREEELSRPHRPRPQHTKSSQDSFSSFLSFFLRFASSIGGTNLEPINGTFSTIGNFSQTKCISFFPNLDNESTRNGRRDSSGTQHPPIHITVILLSTLRRVFFFVSAGFCATRKLFCAGKIQISSSERVFPGELFVVYYNEREQHTKHHDVV